jgi:hypothetical protein
MRPLLRPLLHRLLQGALPGLALLAASATAGAGGPADVIGVAVRCTGSETARLCDFDVTIRSDDRDMRHFADAFEVLAGDGRVLGRRELLHDHADEQPFTRELHGVRVPPGATWVTVRAHHRPLGFGGAARRVDLPR